MVNNFLKKRYFVLSARLFALVIFVFLMIAGISVYTNDPVFAKVLRNTNITGLFVWAYWWPLIIITAIFLGRYWCSICPMELINSLFGFMGAKRKPPAFLKSGWIITIFYAIILMIGIHLFTIHRIPQYTAFYLIALVFIAIIAGLIWEKRTFCTYICPVGHLLGLYSLISANELRVKNQAVCKSCKTKDCIDKDNHYKLTGRSCTSELYPAKIKDNRACLLCGECHKSCSKDNIEIRKRKFGADLLSNIKLKPAETAFFIILSGFVVQETLPEWSRGEKIISSISRFFSGIHSFNGLYDRFFDSILFFAVIPSLFFFIFVLIKRFAAKDSFSQAFSQLVLSILPLTAAMHLAKSVMKMNSRLPYWEYVFNDYKGVNTANMLFKNPELLNTAVSEKNTEYLFILSIIVLFAALYLSSQIIRRQNFKQQISRMISIIATLLYFGIFAYVIFYDLLFL